MDDFETLTEDYSTAPVPGSETVSGLHVALIILGISIALPGFLMGTQLGAEAGFVHAVLAFALGGLMVAIVGALTACVGVEARLSTYMLVQFAFGTTGGRIVNTVFAATLCGWFGVNAALFGDAMVTGITDIFHGEGGWAAYVVAGCALMILTTIFGFKAVDKLSHAAVPVLLVILVLVVVLSLRNAADAAWMVQPAQGMSLGVAISAVVGGNMVGAACIPDFTRYVATRRSAVLAMFAAYGVGCPMILACAAIPGLVTGEADLMKIFLALGLGLPALFVIVFATWTSNAANLYSAGLSFAAIFRSIKPWKLTIVAGVAGTVVALSGIIEMFIPFLLGLGILMPPVAAIYVIDFYLVARRKYDVRRLETAPPVRLPAFAAWIAGAGVGLITAYGSLTLTAMPACDALLVAGGCYILLSRWFPHAVEATATDGVEGKVAS